MAGFIREYASLLPRTACTALIERTGVGAAFGASTIRVDALPAELVATLDGVLARAVDAYRADCPTFAAIHPRVVVTGYAVERRAPCAGPGVWRAPTTHKPRPIVSVLGFLDDGWGELEFEEQPETIVPRAGTIVMFPTGFEYVYRETALRAASHTLTTSLTFHG